jgi:hypothetical protein
MGEKFRKGEVPGVPSDDRWVERLLDELEETPEGKYFRGEPKPKEELNEPGLREKPEAMPKGALVAERELTEALRDDPQFRDFLARTFPTPEELREPRGDELVPTPKDLVSKAETLLSGEERKLFLLDEEYAQKHHLKREVLIVKRPFGYSVYTQSEVIRDPDAGAENDEIIEAMAYRLRQDRMELTFAVGEASTQRRIDETRVTDLDASWYLRASDLLRHLRAAEEI